MFIVKRLGKNGMWSAVSLIDKNGSFRGEAKFETQQEANEYMADYVARLKNRQRSSPEGYGEVKVFDESKPPQETKEDKKKPKAKIKPRIKAKKGKRR